ncbi:glycine zipper domain-containing protein [Oceanisphaera avium]|uniref:Ligand-binding protein SH3 n=1 Tax=Oceanisphaera avium TaxID=1903694 RepID=A0A1Y0CXP4_9GAMM|nr:glycine zipper domain-containing protein [Oceanisphaera avium]ART79656.1 ligand-binding protein SH3 [Oceanisphaera avium]
MTRMRRFTVGAITAAILSTTGCAGMSENQYFNQENMGSLLGAVAGVAIGSQVGGGSGRTVAMILGGVAGGALGKMIGKNLDERDQQALALRTQQMLNQGANHAVSWQSDHSDAQATITPVKSTIKNETVKVQRTEAVQTVANMKLINQTYIAKKSANVRNAPNNTASKVGGLALGSSFTAIGRTDNDWIMVGRKGVTVGYVYAPLVGPKPAAVTQVTQVADVATDLDAMDDVVAKQQGFDLDSIQESQISAQTSCKTLEYKVTAKGKSNSEQVEACQSADGAWELI